MFFIFYIVLHVLYTYTSICGGLYIKIQKGIGRKKRDNDSFWKEAWDGD